MINRTEREKLKALAEKWRGHGFEREMFDVSTVIALCNQLEAQAIKLEVFENRRKLAHSLRAESAHVYAFMEATGDAMDRLAQSGGTDG